MTCTVYYTFSCYLNLNHLVSVDYMMTERTQKSGKLAIRACPQRGRVTPCWSGGTGIRAGLKNRSPHGVVGSIPTSSTSTLGVQTEEHGL